MMSIAYLFKCDKLFILMCAWNGDRNKDFLWRDDISTIARIKFVIERNISGRHNLKWIIKKTWS